MANLIEVWRACLEIVEPRSIMEVGAESGRLTEELLDWAAPRDARVIAVEPDPVDELRTLQRARPALELVEETSLDVLRSFDMPDAIVLDGDHNYFTLSRELELIRDRSAGEVFPLVILHDLGWPLGRRDQYYEPARIPAEHRQAYGAGVRVMPEEPGVVEHGLSFAWAALEEGGDRNGVVSAIEAFREQAPRLRLAVIPIFFGAGVLWSSDADWSDQISNVLGRWDRDPVLARVERSRVYQLAERLAREQELDEARDAIARLEAEQRSLEVEQQRLTATLRGVAESRAFRVAELISRLRRPGDPALTRERVLRAAGAREGQDPR